MTEVHKYIIKERGWVCGLINLTIDAVLNKVFGWKCYRVRFTYLTKQNRPRFTLDQCVRVRHVCLIEDARALKRSLDLYKCEKFRYLLCNGTLECEVKCYLGRY